MGSGPENPSAQFLVRHKSAPGSPANPERVPYYLLIIGEPQSIPSRYQYQLDVTYAVGRLAFPTVDDYETYAASVVAAEARQKRALSAGLFGTRNPDDRATAMSADHLVTPLGEWLASAFPQCHTWVALGPIATKEALRGLLGKSEAPRLLLTATHGMAFPNGDHRQLPDQEGDSLPRLAGPRGMA